MLACQLLSQLCINGRVLPFLLPPFLSDQACTFYTRHNTCDPRFVCIQKHLANVFKHQLVVPCLCYVFNAGDDKAAGRQSDMHRDENHEPETGQGPKQMMHTEKARRKLNMTTHDAGKREQQPSRMTAWRDADGLRHQLAVVWSKNNNGEQRAADALVKAAQDVGGVILLQKIQAAIASNTTVDTWLIDNVVVALKKFKQLPNTTETRNARTAISTALIAEDVNELGLGKAVMQRLQMSRKLLKQAKENRSAIMADKEGCSWAAPSR